MVDMLQKLSRSYEQEILEAQRNGQQSKASESLRRVQANNSIQNTPINPRAPINSRTVT